MNTKLRKIIVRILKDECSRIDEFLINRDVKKRYSAEYGIDSEHPSDEQIMHTIRVLIGEGIVSIQREESIVIGGFTHNYYELTAKGYMEFRPWYVKCWNFFTTDFAKLISLVSAILGIIATWVSLHTQSLIK